MPQGLIKTGSDPRRYVTASEKKKKEKMSYYVKNKEVLFCEVTLKK